MSLSELKAQLKPRLQEYIERTLQPAPRERGKWSCPACGSSDALGIMPGGESWHCFSIGCQRTGDIFTLYALQNNLSSRRDFKEICRGLCSLLSIPYTDASAPAPDRRQHTAPRAAEHKRQPAPAAAADAEQAEATRQPDPAALAAAAEYIARCAACLQEGQDGQPGRDYLTDRRIYRQTAEAFNLGYDPAAGRIVLPNNAGGYQKRSIDPNCSKKDRYRRADGMPAAGLLCLQPEPRDIWIVEGELDALSIWQAGGSAIALAGAACLKPLLSMLQQAAGPARPGQLRFVYLWLDNDPAGQKAEKAAREALQGAGYIVRTYAQDPAAGKLDPNDMLQQDAAQGTQRLQEIISDPGPYFVHDPFYEQQLNAAAVLDAADAALQDGQLTRCLPTGLPAFDAILDGGLYAGLYTIGAISSLGKTTLCLQIGDYIAQQGQDVLIISQEMSAAELVLKSISRLTFQQTAGAAGQSYRDIVHNGGRQHGIIDRARNTYRQQIAPRVYIRQGISDTTAAACRGYILEHITARGCCPVVIIDYLQALQPADPRMTDKQAIDSAVLELKRIARDYSTPVLCISSFNRAAYNTAASFAAFKEAGSIEYGSDVVIALQYKGQGDSDFDLAEKAQQQPRPLQLCVLKNRFGTLGSCDLSFYSAFNCFTGAGAAPRSCRGEQIPCF